uniref:Integral membrane bound transporter domain-containing protein n=1 Tax=Leersia perrieri TaxID=77586 RepID=A0A0D9XN13_9ORYZ
MAVPLATSGVHVSIMPPAPPQEEQVVDVLAQRWRWSVASGFRAALACTIVGVASVYAPLAIRRHLTFPAFAYVVTVIVMTTGEGDATLGSALRATLAALHATVMGAVPSVLPLWLAHRTGAGESVVATTAVVALSTFAVALAGSAGPVAKRIALGQIIIVYVARFRQESMPVLLHPANVVACTALGVVAALLGVSLPLPRLARREARDKRAAYLEVAAERVRLLAHAFQLHLHEAERPACCCRRRLSACIMSQVDRAASAGAVLLRRISSVQGDLQWERIPALLRRRWCIWDDGEGDQQVGARLPELIEMPLRGMEMACTQMQQQQHVPTTGINTCCTSSICPTSTATWVQHATDQVRLALLTKRNSSSTGSSIEMATKLASTAMETPSAQLGQHDNDDVNVDQQLAPSVFLMCMDLLLHGSAAGSSPPPPKLQLPAIHPDAVASQAGKVATTKDQDGDGEQSPQPGQMKKKKHIKKETITSRVVVASKCGFSLGLAVLLGLLFSSDHGFWSGLIVATTMSTARDWTWALAIARAHGTAIGSVYGALACLLIDQRRHMELRFVALLPWLILTAGFLKRSRAYGAAGGVAAAVSGIIIVGRRYDEPPMAFTMARLVETFIGLACTVVADLVFQPAARPSAKAKAQLARCLKALKGCFDSTSKVKVKAVQQQVGLLEKCVAEAAGEPHFLPFPANSYHKVVASMGRMAQLLYLYTHARAAAAVALDEDDATQRFHSLVSASLDRSSIRLRSCKVKDEEKEKQQEEDLEAGFRVSSCSCNCNDEETPETVVHSFLNHALLQQKHREQEAAATTTKTRYLMASIGFCMGEMAKEAQSLEAYLLDLILCSH